MHKILKSILLFFLILSFTKLLAANKNENFFTVKGKQIIDPAGNPIILKGINIGNWLVPEGYMFKFGNVSSPRLINEMITELIGPDDAKEFWKKFQDVYITKNDIEFIKKTGFNSIRIPFNYKSFVNENNYEMLEGPGYELLDRIVNWCKEENLYIVLDMHCAPGGQTGDNIDDSWGYPFLFESAESQNLTAAIWKKLAGKYKDEKIIIGYDLLNEPIAHYFNAEELNPLLEPLYKKIVKEIREVDQNHLIFLGGAQWNSNFKVFGAPFDDKLVYTFHKYWTEPTQDVIQDYIDFSDKYDVPLYLGESGENTNQWIESFRKVLEENNIGWCFWPYKKLDATSNVVSINMPEKYDTLISYAKKPRVTFEEIRNSRPLKKIVMEILNNFLENSKFKNCVVNEEYIKALGLNPLSNKK